MKGKYLYGVIKKPKDTSEVARSEAEGLLGRWRKKDGLSTIDFRSLSAVVAEAEWKDYHCLPKKEVVKELISHQQTIEKIMENFGSVLPVKFGTILKDKEEVRSVLEKRYSFLKEALRKMEAKIELDLVCFWNAEKAAQMAFQESKKVKNFYKKITSGGKTPRTVARQRPRLLVPPAEPLATHGRGEGVEDKIALGKLVADYLASKREKLSDQILKTLKRVAVENCPHVLADVNILLNQAFLVEKENEETFNHALNKLNSKFAELINFRLVGPLPPYSFATVVIEVLDKKEVESAKKLLKLEGEPGKEKIKQAFDKLAFQLHPDKGGDPLEFSLAAKGYELLRKYLNQGLVGLKLHKWKEQNRL